MSDENKPNWNDAPKWASWLAQNDCGRWFWFEEKPIKLNSVWHSENKNKMYAKAKIEGWQQTLQQRPSENYPSVRQIWREKETNNNVEIIFVSKITVGFVDSDGIEHFVPKESYFLKMFLVV